MIAFLLYGGMLLTVLPHEPACPGSRISVVPAGVLAAFLFRHSDPLPPRQEVQLGLEEEIAADASSREQYELPSPRDVPVLWRRTQNDKGVVRPFRERED